MSQFAIFGTTSIILFAMGLYGIFTRPHLFRKILAANIMAVSVFLLLITIAQRNPELADPVPHAMVLTGIVVSVSATAFGLSLLRRLNRRQIPPYLDVCVEPEADARAVTKTGEET
ncbi:NADH-quinone oxidoreductase subunit K [Desulfurispirillum indicum]|uniref:NADH-ubiquinone oxidoreductase chain 4L n=1 Tax=Desulfurispirillum indicum (strain ATCC BAA-1389 / DSM 22839 / S5) TaxID=653733 RepID=E6W1P5_DESIS|nr:NADH-quinone oxidoreductase subunit K [Desulfurispirillum indicum]ADU66594.1 NADH-ubiquinone oxidoreductase chain 4L [Desulfurispirillum indicum S5]UCZ55913.1 NADH-quinone oxidoreductase subunit K [Desulfurispirillum indicum]